MLILFDDDIKESVKATEKNDERNAISANPEHYLFTIFRGSIAPDSYRKPKKNFSRRCAARKNFLKSTSLPNKES